MHGKPLSPARSQDFIALDTPRTDPQAIISFEDLRVDFGSERVSIGDDYIPVTATEFRILRTLILQSMWIVRRETLIDAMHKAHTSATSKSLHVHISRLRAKLRRHGKWIRTFNGIGYRFMPGGKSIQEP
jgi:DNA-binding response OmpR family regulator